MRQNVTLSVSKPLLRRARDVAARRGLSLSALLTEVLRALVEREETWERAKSRALAMLENPPLRGVTRIRDRAALHRRADLRK